MMIYIARPWARRAWLHWLRQWLKNDWWSPPWTVDIEPRSNPWITTRWDGHWQRTTNHSWILDEDERSESEDGWRRDEEDDYMDCFRNPSLRGWGNEVYIERPEGAIQALTLDSDERSEEDGEGWIEWNERGIRNLNPSLKRRRKRRKKGVKAKSIYAWIFLRMFNTVRGHFKSFFGPAFVRFLPLFGPALGGGFCGPKSPNLSKNMKKSLERIVHLFHPFSNYFRNSNFMIDQIINLQINKSSNQKDWRINRSFHFISIWFEYWMDSFFNSSIHCLIHFNSEWIH